MTKIRKKSTPSYTIPLSTMKEMEDLIRNTHNTGKEHGMSMCTRNHEILAGKRSIGDEGGIAISLECKSKKDKYVGTFHTHPDLSEAAASAQDLWSSCLKINNFDCVGKNRFGEIVCYDKKKKGTSCTNDSKQLKDIEDTFYDTTTGDLEPIKKELYKEVDKVADKHFNKIKVK